MYMLLKTCQYIYTRSLYPNLNAALVARIKDQVDLATKTQGKKSRSVPRSLGLTVVVCPDKINDSGYLRRQNYTEEKSSWKDEIRRSCRPEQGQSRGRA